MDLFKFPESIYRIPWALIGLAAYLSTQLKRDRNLGVAHSRIREFWINVPDSALSQQHKPYFITNRKQIILISPANFPLPRIGKNKLNAEACTKTKRSVPTFRFA